MISKGKFLQNANFYLPVSQEYFTLFPFHSEGKLLYFIFSSFITLPLHQDIFLSYPRYREHVFQQSLLLLHGLQFSLQLLLRRITLPLILQYHLPCICFFLGNFPVKNAMKQQTLPFTTMTTIAGLPMLLSVYGLIMGF